MTDAVWNRDEPQSPCRKICVIHPQARLCIGCYRSIDEIQAWPNLGSAARIAIIEALESRKDRVQPVRRGGRRTRLRQRAPNEADSES